MGATALWMETNAQANLRYSSALVEVHAQILVSLSPTRLERSERGREDARSKGKGRRSTRISLSIVLTIRIRVVGSVPFSGGKGSFQHEQTHR